MHGPDFTSFPISVNALVLLVAGLVVWHSGSKLATLADAIAENTRLTRALAGALLLGAATSLPEIATTVTAGTLDDAPLAVNNLFGGVAMQLAILALIDFWCVRGGALTFFSPAPVLMLGGILLIIQGALAVMAIAVGDVPLVARIGVWPLLLMGSYLLSLYFMQGFADRDTWTPARLPETDEGIQDVRREIRKEGAKRSLTRMGVLFAGNCMLVLFGGWGVSSAANALSIQSGIGSGFIGATLVALTTSLPEISTTAGAVRMGAYTLAISNIFGTNALEIALLLPADLAYRQGCIINAVDESALFLAGLGILMTSLFLWGLLERRDRDWWGMGVDSWWVLSTYAVGLGLLYFLSA